MEVSIDRKLGCICKKSLGVIARTGNSKQQRWLIGNLTSHSWKLDPQPWTQALTEHIPLTILRGLHDVRSYTGSFVHLRRRIIGDSAVEFGLGIAAIPRWQLRCCLGNDVILRRSRALRLGARRQTRNPQTHRDPQAEEWIGNSHLIGKSEQRQGTSRMKTEAMELR